LARIDAVIQHGERTLNSVDPYPGGLLKRIHYSPDDRWVKADVASVFRTAGLRLLEDIYGTQSQNYRDFEAFTDQTNTLAAYKRATGLIAAVRDDVDHLFPAGGGDRRGVPKPADGTAVFVVHGHEDAPREQVARYLTQLGVTPIILHEQPSKGMTLIEKFESHAGVGFAVVLLTPDDVGHARTEPERPKFRARQNVILELGFFLGRLGRERVCAVLKGDVERPSDYDGVTYIPFDDGGGWRLLLARELKAGGN